jgi:hypothetical protein
LIVGGLNKIIQALQIVSETLSEFLKGFAKSAIHVIKTR